MTPLESDTASRKGAEASSSLAPIARRVSRSWRYSGSARVRVAVPEGDVEEILVDAVCAGQADGNHYDEQ